MSTVEILSLLSLICYIAAGISFVLAVFFWFRFKIPTVIGDLSGRTARKSIALMRENNERSGGKSYRPSAVNFSRGKTTESVDSNQKLTRNKAKNKDTGKTASEPVKSVKEPVRPETSLLKENAVEAPVADQTELLVDDEATGLLKDSDETTLLEPAEPQSVPRTGGKKLVMLEDIMIINTEEKIS